MKPMFTKENIMLPNINLSKYTKERVLNGHNYATMKTWSDKPRQKKSLGKIIKHLIKLLIKGKENVT